MFTKNNLEQIERQGYTPEEIEKQLESFKNGFPPVHLISAATSAYGISQMDEDEEARYVSIFENSLSSGLKTLKFVPASGAASRMFKQLYEFLDSGVEDKFIETFIDQLEKFAFYNELKSKYDGTDKKEIVKTILNEDGLNYGNLPKGLLAFHKYKDHSRTPFEEHLVEAASYCTGSDGIARVHFTISPEHEEAFRNLFEKVKSTYQKRFGFQLEVTFSFQHKSTDTIAVDLTNEPVKTKDGELIFRPGGHGALIQNLGDLDADLIFIKNIDNVVPDHIKQFTKKYKKALAGYLVTIRNKVYSLLEKLDKEEHQKDEKFLQSVESFMKKELSIDFDAESMSQQEKILFFHTKLNRPVRICGMVKNEGEPGGGPFFAKNQDGTISLQIVEKAQIDLNDSKQQELLNNSTHFNPVDLTCCTKNYKGDKFDLSKFIDPQTGFISIKSKDGIEMKALELPGLWNGAMSDWNTIFVEVPIQTFNPVKTINDLLRPEHQ